MTVYKISVYDSVLSVGQRSSVIDLSIRAGLYGYISGSYGKSTRLNGNIVVISAKDGVSVECSNNNTILKDTDWFKQYRKTPSAWLN